VLQLTENNGIIGSQFEGSGTLPNQFLNTFQIAIKEVAAAAIKNAIIINLIINSDSMNKVIQLLQRNYGTSEPFVKRSFPVPIFRDVLTI
jgi:hypothetical protein